MLICPCACKINNASDCLPDAKLIAMQPSLQVSETKKMSHNDSIFHAEPFFNGFRDVYQLVSQAIGLNIVASAVNFDTLVNRIDLNVSRQDVLWPEISDRFKSRTARLCKARSWWLKLQKKIKKLLTDGMLFETLSSHTAN
jgi:hypothetical protein